MTKDFSPRRSLATDETFQELLRLVLEFAENQKFGAQAVANITHGIAKLDEAGRLGGLGGSVDDALAALERAAAHVAPEMKPQHVGNIMWAYATLRRMPGEETWGALEGAAARVAPEMVPQALANTMWAYATLGRMLGEGTWGALEGAAARVAPEMVPQALSNTMWSYATLGRILGEGTWGALEGAAARVAPEMKPQEVSNTMWSYATLGRMPGEETWGALEGAAARVATEMKPQHVANTMWAYATLGRMPGEETWGALEGAAARVAPEMKPQDVANTAWAYTTLATLRSVELPSYYAALWDRACGMDAAAFHDEELRQLFHAHLMLERLYISTRSTVKVAYPEWLTTEARNVWMRQVRDDATVSDSHRRLARVIGELGVGHEVELVTNDGCFSMDIYLPDHDVCVEYDGPSHFYKIDDKDSYSPSRDASMTRTAKTELRDLFLAKQCAKLVTVPWFEFDRVKNSPEKRRVYVKKKLADAGVRI